MLVVRRFVLSVPKRLRPLLRRRYHGVFAPNAPLRPLVTARAPEDNAAATLKIPPHLPSDRLS